MSTLTVTITEALTLDGDNLGTSRTLTYSDVNYAYRQTLNVATGSMQTLLTLGTAVAGGSIVRTNFRYARIRNADATNYITLRVQKTGAETAYFRIDPGEFFVLTHSALDADGAGASFAAFADIDTLAAEADTAACKVELFVATA
jgi:hypothetical protein